MFERIVLGGVGSAEPAWIAEISAGSPREAQEMPRPYFYKLVLSSTIQDKRLRIPENFVKKFRDELSSVATLNVPDGHVWHVGIRKSESKLWFHEGWQEFVQHYSIGIGYFLVFRYEGGTTFQVFIYNLTTSEINYHSNGRVPSEMPHHSRQYHVFKDMEDDDAVDISSSSTYYPSGDSLKRKAVNSSVDQLTLSRGYNSMHLQNLFNGTVHQQKGGANSHAGMRPIEDIVIQAGGIKFKSEDEVKVQSADQSTRKIKKSSKKKRKNDPNEPMPSALQEEDGEMRFRFYASASTRKRLVTAEEREKAINAAKMFEPSNPFCRVVLRPSYLYRGCIMYLPSCFAEKHLNGVSGFIKLQSTDGKQWPVRCLYRGGRAKLSQGWYDFSLENNLEEGDVCVFELMRAREVVLQVTVFRVVEEGGLLSHHGR